MIERKIVENIVNEFLQDKDLFLVNTKITKDNNITITIDGDKGVNIDNCIELNKHINSLLDRDKEDYQLTVSSFGLEEYFTLLRQYKKNIGQNVELVLNSGEKLNGKLDSVTDQEDIVLQVKKKQEKTNIPFADITKARVILTI